MSRYRENIYKVASDPSVKEKKTKTTKMLINFYFFEFKKKQKAGKLINSFWRVFVEVSLSTHENLLKKGSK